jgi:hypothetical protein
LRFALAREFIKRDDASFTHYGGVGRANGSERRIGHCDLAGAAAVLFEQEPIGALNALQRFANVESGGNAGFDLRADLHIGAGLIYAALLHQAQGTEVKRAGIIRVGASETRKQRFGIGGAPAEVGLDAARI